MAHDYDPDDTAERRSKRDRINRLRERLSRATTMPHDYDPDDTAERRSKRDRIARLRERLSRARAFKSHDDLCAVMAGVLDLLGDEL